MSQGSRRRSRSVSGFDDFDLSRNAGFDDGYKSRRSRTWSRSPDFDLDLGLPAGEPSATHRSRHHRSRYRPPSISVAQIGAAFDDFDLSGPVDDSLFASAHTSPYYPPSASRSRVPSSGTTRSRSRRRPSISVGDDAGLFSFEGDNSSPGGSSRAWEPTSATEGVRASSPFKSRFFGSHTSSSSPSGLIASGSHEEQPADFDWRHSPSSRRSKRSSFFEHASGGDGNRVPSSRASSESRRHRFRPQIHATSFHSGFSDQMYIDDDGQQRFTKGTELDSVYSGYKDVGERAYESRKAYDARKAEFPVRKRNLLGPVAATGEEYEGLDGNYTVPEHRELRRLSHRAFQDRRAEVLGRESFNERFGSVWVKRGYQTGEDSLANHRKVAAQLRTNANSLKDTREMHTDAIIKLGFPEDELTSMSSWGSRRSSGRR